MYPVAVLARCRPCCVLLLLCSARCPSLPPHPSPRPSWRRYPSWLRHLSYMAHCMWRRRLTHSHCSPRRPSLPCAHCFVIRRCLALPHVLSHAARPARPRFRTCPVRLTISCVFVSVRVRVVEIGALLADSERRMTTRLLVVAAMSATVHRFWCTPLMKVLLRPPRRHAQAWVHPYLRPYLGELRQGRF